ncbi:MAG: DJ-1/PfpI family protein [Actinomycetota bacterium]|nr:DJ-1/PfpI family protein [Actinomycetota bacterium]
MSTETRSSPLSIGMVLFAQLTQLDLAGPYEVFSRMPNTRVHLIAASPEPVRSEHGLSIAPTTGFDSAPPLDILFVPGGPGQQQVMEDARFVGFLRERGDEARYVTSVCTGSLLLGAAGLLRGYRATTHWMFLELLRPLGAEPVGERVVVDRNRITGGGITAGIDFGLVIAAELVGEETAKKIQLSIEYDPAPPFKGGSPESADDALVRCVSEQGRRLFESRRRQVERVADRLREGTVPAGSAE